MKSKKMTYLLVACVVAIWGIVFYRVFMVSGSDEPIESLQTRTEKASYFKAVDHAKDVYTLELDYADPFADGAVFEVEKMPAENGVKATVLPVIPVKPIVNWTGIFYRGYIINPGSKNKVALLTVNGKDLMLTEGQESGEIKLVKYAGDSVQVQYQHSSKYISIK